MIQTTLLYSVLMLAASPYIDSKDTNYYKAVPDEAKAKYTECMQQIERAAAIGTIEELLHIANDQECKAADTVIKFYYP